MPPVFYLCLYPDSCVLAASRGLPPPLPKTQDSGGKTAGATETHGGHRAYMWYSMTYTTTPVTLTYSQIGRVQRAMRRCGS